MEEESSYIEKTKSANNENMIPTLLQGSNPSKTPRKRIPNSENMIPTLLQGSTSSKAPSKRIQRNHIEEKIIGDINAGVESRSTR